MKDVLMSTKELFSTLSIVDKVAVIVYFTIAVALIVITLNEF